MWLQGGEIEQELAKVRSKVEVPTQTPKTNSVASENRIAKVSVV